MKQMIYISVVYFLCLFFSTPVYSQETVSKEELYKALAKNLNRYETEKKVVIPVIDETLFTANDLLAFFGCKTFETVNAFLKKKGYEFDNVSDYAPDGKSYGYYSIKYYPTSLPNRTFPINAIASIRPNGKGTWGISTSVQTHATQIISEFEAAGFVPVETQKYGLDVITVYRSKALTFSVVYGKNALPDDGMKYYTISVMQE